MSPASIGYDFHSAKFMQKNKNIKQFDMQEDPQNSELKGVSVRNQNNGNNILLEARHISATAI